MYIQPMQKRTNKFWVKVRGNNLLAKSVLNYFLFRRGSLKIKGTLLAERVDSQMELGGQQEAEHTNLWKNI